MGETVTFKDRELVVIRRFGERWFTRGDIGKALGYEDDKSIYRVFSRNADEFTDSMTTVVKMTTVTGLKDTRIFSIRGAHLLAMLSRTDVAKEFRRFLLDLLERERRAPPRLPALSRDDARRARQVRYQKLQLTKAVWELDELGVDVTAIDMNVVRSFARLMLSDERQAA